MGSLVVALLATLLTSAAPATAQLSTSSVRTFGRVSTADDSIRVPVDAPAQPADVGAAAFTIEQWLRCRDQDNLPPVDSLTRPGDSETATFDWIYGRIFLDRDILGLPPEAGGDFGASVHPLAGDAGVSVVRFGAERTDVVLTIQGSSDVCDDTWHHVAVGRDEADRLFVSVDGVEDYRSQGTIAGDLSYPDETGSGQDPFLVWGNEKHAFWSGYRGYLDELRVWSVARTAGQVGDERFTTLSGDTAGLELYLRLEEAAGQTLVDSTGKNDGAMVYLGVSGNGEWTTSVPPDGGTTTTSTSSTSSSSSSTSSSTSSTSSSSSTLAAPGTTSSTSTVTAPSLPDTSTSLSSDPISTTSTTFDPGPSTTSTIGSTDWTTTSTTVPEGCGSGCEDLDPCTIDACVAGVCSHELPPGPAGAVCELRRLMDSPLCPAAPPRARIERSIAHRLAAATLLLDRAVDAGAERPRGRRKTNAAVAKLREAESSIRRAADRKHLAPECGVGLLGVLGRAHGALCSVTSGRDAPSTRSAP